MHSSAIVPPNPNPSELVTSIQKKHFHFLLIDLYWLGWVGGDYGSLLHNSMFWGLFLGLQPSGAAARLCVPAEWFQRIILTTVANTQPERVVQYDSDAIATASLKKAITIYNIQGCTVIQYLQYLIPQPPVVKREFEDTRCKVSFPATVQFLKGEANMIQQNRKTIQQHK